MIFHSMDKTSFSLFYSLTIFYNKYKYTLFQGCIFKIFNSFSFDGAASKTSLTLNACESVLINHVDMLIISSSWLRFWKVPHSLSTGEAVTDFLRRRVLPECLILYRFYLLSTSVTLFEKIKTVLLFQRQLQLQLRRLITCSFSKLTELQSSSGRLFNSLTVTVKCQRHFY